MRAVLVLTFLLEVLVRTILLEPPFLWARVAHVSSGAPLRARGAQPSAKPSRCVPKCGQRDGAQTADVDGELPMFSAGAVSSGGGPAVAAAGVSRHPDGDSAGAPCVAGAQCLRERFFWIC